MSQPPSPTGPPLHTPPGDALLSTKLYIPPVRPGLVPRPRLLSRLDQGLARRLILLSGPAGSGKTTLLSVWLAQGEQNAAERWAHERQAQGNALPALVQEMEEIACARVALAGHRPAEALALLAPLAEAAERQQRHGRLIEALALQALALQASGRTAQALACLTKALALAEPEGYVRVFVDDVRLPKSRRLRKSVWSTPHAPIVAVLMSRVRLSPVPRLPAIARAGGARRSWAGGRA